MKKLKPLELSNCPNDIAGAISFLRRSGFSKVETVGVLIENHGLTPSEAKVHVHASETWSDVRDQDERFHDDLIAAVTPAGETDG